MMLVHVNDIVTPAMYVYSTLVIQYSTRASAVGSRISLEIQQHTRET